MEQSEIFDWHSRVLLESGATFRPIDLARAINVSAATIRFYEREGFLPPVERRDSGHRLYGANHLRALLAARAMMDGYGWQDAKRVMVSVHAGNVDHARSLVDARHAAIDRERQQAAATESVLGTLAEPAPRPSRGNLHAGQMRIGAVAALLGVTIPTLRFWEAEGLVRPERDQFSRYRVYGEGELEQLRIVATLRRANHGVSEIRDIVDELRRGNPAAALRAVQQRMQQLAEASQACMRATAMLYAYLESLTTEASQV